MDSAKRAVLFREVNDRMYELLALDPELPGEFLCECGSECDRRVVLAPVAYAALKSGGESVRAPECRDRRLQQHIRDRLPFPGVAAAA